MTVMRNNQILYLPVFANKHEVFFFLNQSYIGCDTKKDIKDGSNVLGRVLEPWGCHQQR